MARINIEDSIYRDERFYKLAAIEGKFKAIGLLVCAWDLAHRWYLKHPEHLVPFAEFCSEKSLMILLDVGLAEHRENGVYIKGSEQHCSYLKARSDAGKRGGLKSQENLSSKRKQNQPSYSFSFSNSISDSKKYMCDSNESHQPEFSFDDIYNAYPKRMGSMNKAKGMEKLKRLIKNKSDFDDALIAVQRYNEFCVETKKVKTELVKMFSSFFDSNGDWREWINYKKEKQKTSMDAWLEKYKDEA